MATTVKKKFKIDGMHCSSCALVIDGDLEDLPGVKQAKTNYAKAETEVEFDPQQVQEPQIIQVISKSGYLVIPSN